VFAIALIVILDNSGVNVTALVAGLGIGGIAIGLAAQGIFSDLFAALSSCIRQAVPRGDTIRYGTGTDVTIGTVRADRLKTTRLRSQTGEQVEHATQAARTGKCATWPKPKSPESRLLSA
jgi:small-conductance mechanosensitive channel